MEVVFLFHLIKMGGGCVAVCFLFIICRTKHIIGAVDVLVDVPVAIAVMFSCWVCHVLFETLICSNQQCGSMSSTHQIKRNVV